MRKLNRYRHASWAVRRKHIQIGRWRYLRRLDDLTRRYFVDLLVETAFEQNAFYRMLVGRDLRDLTVLSVP